MAEVIHSYLMINFALQIIIANSEQENKAFPVWSQSSTGRGFIIFCKEWLHGLIKYSQSLSLFQYSILLLMGKPIFDW